MSLNKLRWIAAPLALAGVAAACSSTASTDSVESAPPSEDAQYGQIVELTDAVEAAGLDCAPWEMPKRQRLAADSRYCSVQRDTFIDAAIYTTEANKEKAIRESVKFAQMERRYAGR